MLDSLGIPINTASYKIVFLDFATVDSSIDLSVPAAENLPLHLSNPAYDSVTTMHINMLPEHLVNDVYACVSLALRSADNHGSDDKEPVQGEGL